MSRLFWVAIAIFAFVPAVLALTCNPQGYLKDCGYPGIDRGECESKGCCWAENDAKNPYCFFTNPTIQSYTVSKISDTAIGTNIALTLNGKGSGIYGPDASNLLVEYIYDTDTRFHVKITNPKQKRFEVPQSVVPRSNPASAAGNPTYKVVTEKINFGFAVVRADSDEVLFNTSVPSTGIFNGLIFEDQYMEISTQLSEKPYLYGLGEQAQPFLIDTTGRRQNTMWASDHLTPMYQNTYGQHPFYIEIDPETGKAYGVLLLNNQGMDVGAFPGGLTYRVIGGVFDFYFFMGPTPAEVISQYHSFIGTPALPPFWSLGWHQCRWGYDNISDLQDVVTQYKYNQIPLDTLWSDIDYMDSRVAFTWDKKNFPADKMGAFVNNLHTSGQHYVVIVDPGIHNVSGNPSYETGVRDNVFIRQADGKEYIGKVWPGSTAFPDWFHPNASDWWYNSIRSWFAQGVAVDGLWIDMNEPANFCDGYCDGRPVPKAPEGQFDPNYPPYKINNFGDRVRLDAHTIPMDTVHYGGILHYHTHNLYGTMETIYTRDALVKIQKKRPLIISRSTFVGQGHFGGHWLGDNVSNWTDLINSISGILNFQIFGIPMVGADICGFAGDTNVELCIRWTQLGSFYPFARNHNTEGAMSQEPYRWPDVANVARRVLAFRYSLLPYYYTLFAKANENGGFVWTPLGFAYPKDTTALPIDRQFLVGDAVLVTPVLEEGARSVRGYFPKDTWYDVDSGNLFRTPDQEADWVTLDAPLQTIPVHIRGARIIPTSAFTKAPLNTAVLRKGDFGILIAPCAEHGRAHGSLFWDDGDNLDITKSSSVKFFLDLDSKKITSTVVRNNFRITNALDDLYIFNFPQKPTTFRVNGAVVEKVEIDYASNKLLLVSNLKIDLNVNTTITWEY